MDFLPMPHHVRRLEGRFCIRYNGCIMLQDTGAVGAFCMPGCCAIPSGKKPGLS